MSRTIVVTGASRGIGKAISYGFAQKGTNIIINCIHNAELLYQVQGELILRGAQCEAFVGDISDFDTAARLFDAAHTRFGPIDVLVNNAGISKIGLFQELRRADWERIMNVNVGSVYNCCHFALPDMIKAQRGKIINISSVWGCVGASCEAAYSASKGAVNALTKALAKELAPSSIQVNAIACGAIDTEMNACFSDEELHSLCEEIPAGRMGTPDEVARTVLQFADAESYLTGQVVALDGGWI